MQHDVIRLVGPGGAGKTTTGARLAQRLGLTFVDLDERFAETHGDISEYLDVHGYASYTMQNVQNYLEGIVAVAGPHVLALSSGFMTYATGVHPDYARVRGEIAASATTLVLLPSLDYETCVAETVRRQLGRPFCRSAERQEEVIRQRFGVYRNLPAAKLDTMKPVSEVVDAAVVNLLPNIRSQPAAADAFMSRRGWSGTLRRFARARAAATFASRLTMAGVGIRAVQDALGHKSIAMTVRYSHLAPDFMADAVEKLVPETAPPESQIPTGTRTDTDAIASIASASKSVH